MKCEAILKQVDGVTRYLYLCPRGRAIVDSSTSNAQEWQFDVALTSRDKREAKRLHKRLLDEEEAQ